MRALVSTRKGLFELVKNSDAWSIGERHFLGEPVSMALHDARDGALYAALNLGHFGTKLHRKDKGSDSWTEVAVPAYPPKPEGNEEKGDWALKQIWALETGGPDEPGVLWAGTNPGGLFKSSDRGASWQLVEPLWNDPTRPQWFGGGYDSPGIHSVCVDPRNSKHLLVAVSCGGVWRSEDGGASWSTATKGMSAPYMPPEMAENPEAQDPHRMVRCAGQPDVLWCQHHGGIWRSTDNARSWKEIKAPVSSFGFAVAVDPREGRRAWFVPGEADQRRIPVDAAMIVNRTDDGGETFTTQRNGLPQQHCYDLVYRHGLALHADGKTLAMASTTGGLWLSENGGESWQTVSNNLPPVYALSFG